MSDKWKMKYENQKKTEKKPRTSMAQSMIRIDLTQKLSDLEPGEYTQIYFQFLVY